jgi:hypothetical protein
MIAMLPFALALAGSSLVLTVADEIPNYNMQPTCRAAVEMMGSQGRTVESCMRGETQAREELAKHWATAPAEEKKRCLQTAMLGASPSYVELLICLEIHRDSRARQQQQTDEQAKAKPRKPAAKP